MNCLCRPPDNLPIAVVSDKGGSCPKTGAKCLKTGAFTLPEVLISMVILMLAFTSAYVGIGCWMLLSHRTADYTAGMALVQAKMFDIRATDYPSTNFSSTSTITNINNISVDMNKGATKFEVPGTLTSVIQPITWGHLVTVTLVVKEVDGSYLTNSLQTVVNNYSGGRGP